jgi:hypothetical protein
MPVLCSVHVHCTPVTVCVLSIDVHKPHKHIHMYGVANVSVLSNLHDFNYLIYFYQLQ